MLLHFRIKSTGKVAKVFIMIMHAYAFNSDGLQPNSEPQYKESHTFVPQFFMCFPLDSQNQADPNSAFRLPHWRLRVQVLTGQYDESGPSRQIESTRSEGHRY